MRQRARICLPSTRQDPLPQRNQNGNPSSCFYRSNPSQTFRICSSLLRVLTFQALTNSTNRMRLANKASITKLQHHRRPSHKHDPLTTRRPAKPQG